MACSTCYHRIHAIACQSVGRYFVLMLFTAKYFLVRVCLFVCLFMNFWLLLQGVEFFDEKLNSLCMTWLVDHGKPFFIIIVVVIINFSVNDLWSYEWYFSKQLPHADEFFRFFFFHNCKAHSC